MEYIPVIVEGMERRYPIEHVKIVEDLPNDGALVIVRYPSFSIAGEISLETRAKLLAHRCLTGDTVAVNREDSALIRWLNEPGPPGPDENWLEALKRHWGT
jgi:hypothetical protein